MQSAQDILGRLTVVVLHKVDLATDRLFKLCLVKALEEEATLVAEHIGLNHQDIWNIGWGYFQDWSSSFNRRCRY